MAEHVSRVPGSRSIARTVAGFYLLVAFEFFYMASPFAAYFYSIYGPGLTFLNGIPALAWLSDTFLPHVVMETSSPILKTIRMLGPVFAVTGAAVFLVAAVPVYYAKLKRSGPVTGGLYKFIRHPQYAGLIVWGMGLVILWPRTIALLLFVAMLFVYFFLARIEEQECERRFGIRYLKYRNATGMFLPFRVHALPSFPGLPRSRLNRIAVVVTLYCCVSLAALGLSAQMKTWSLQNLYTHSTGNAVFISVTAMSADSLARLVACTLSHPDVRSQLLQGRKGTRYVNYVMPDDLYLMEVPMLQRGTSHGNIGLSYGDSDPRYLKIIITEAVTRDAGSGVEMLRSVVERIPLMEIRIDPAIPAVLDVCRLPRDSALHGLPFPVF